MAERMNIVMLMIMVVASMQLQGLMAQTRHIVGDSTGWTVPSAPSAYSTWASSQTFTVGDTLVFTFVTGAHTVAEVTRSAYDACNGTSPISLTGNGPATITLPSAGTRYFICTVGSHCSLGQKVAVNISAATTTSPPAAQPATPPTTTPITPVAAPVSPPPSSSPAPAAAPVSPPVVSTPVPAPAPGPSSGPATYIVGDGLGWTVPSTGANTYRTWASDKTFVAGDVLVFNFASGAHNVAEVSRTAFDSCSSTSPIRVITTSPARITLTGGSHYFICTFPQHCSLGQQLAINVTGSSTATPPSSIASPPSTPSAESPNGVSAPPPPNAASSVAAGALLPVALLSLALAFLY